MDNTLILIGIAVIVIIGIIILIVILFKKKPAPALPPVKDDLLFRELSLEKETIFNANLKKESKLIIIRDGEIIESLGKETLTLDILEKYKDSMLRCYIFEKHTVGNMLCDGEKEIKLFDLKYKFPISFSFKGVYGIHVTDELLFLREFAKNRELSKKEFENFNKDYISALVQEYFCSQLSYKKDSIIEIESNLIVFEQNLLVYLNNQIDEGYIITYFNAEFDIIKNEEYKKLSSQLMSGQKLQILGYTYQEEKLSNFIKDNTKKIFVEIGEGKLKEERDDVGGYFEKDSAKNNKK